jgi:hypothetical protein
MRGAGRVSLSAILGLLAISELGISTVSARGAAEPSAPELLARMASKYAQCKSYQDSGVVSILYFGPAGDRTEQRPFRTAFVRPDRFRFEYQETGTFGATRRYIVWRLESRVRTWWDVKPGIEEGMSLGSALAGATGVSGGSAHTVPAMLLPGEVQGRRLTDMTEVKRIPDADIAGTSCLCVEGKYADVLRTVCVDRKTLLVRRIEYEETFPQFHTHETTTYEPVIDEPIAQEFLDFDPPSPK